MRPSMRRYLMPLPIRPLHYPLIILQPRIIIPSNKKRRLDTLGLQDIQQFISILERPIVIGQGDSSEGCAPGDDGGAVGFVDCGEVVTEKGFVGVGFVTTVVWDLKVVEDGIAP